MPSVIHKKSIRSDRSSLGLHKTSIRLSRRSEQKKPTMVGVKLMKLKKSSVDQRNSSVERKKRSILRGTPADVRKPLSFDQRASSDDHRKSSTSMARHSINETGRKSIDHSSKGEKSPTVRKKFRVSRAATDILKAVERINEPEGFSYYSFSDTDSIKYDEGARKLGPALVSTVSEFDKTLHRLSKLVAPVKQKKRKTGKDTSPDGSFDDTKHSRELRSGSSFLDADLLEKDETSEDFGPPSVEESKELLSNFLEESFFSMKFFDTLGQLPSIDKVSLDSSIKEFFKSATKEYVVVKFAGKDVGKFVDPLTGTSLSSTSSEMLEKVKRPSSRSRLSLRSRRSSNLDMLVEEEQFDEEEEGEEEESPFIPRELEEDEELLTLEGLDSDEEEDYLIEDGEPLEDTAMDIYWHQQKHVLIGDALRVAEEGVANQEETALQEIIAKFFDRIIRKVVAKVESIRPAFLLRKTLDKGALMRELQDKLQDLEIEQKARLFLSRKVVEYHRRKNSYRNLDEDSPETFTDNMEKYEEALTVLDVAISKEEEIKESAAIEIDRGKKKLEEAEIIERESYNNFETLIRETMTKENYNSLKRVSTEFHIRFVEY